MLYISNILYPNVLVSVTHDTNLDLHTISSKILENTHQYLWNVYKRLVILRLKIVF